MRLRRVALGFLQGFRRLALASTKTTAKILSTQGHSRVWFAARLYQEVSSSR